MTFRPLRDYLVVRPLERTISTTVAVVSHERYSRGRVLSVGPGRVSAQGDPLELAVRPGDQVLFEEHRLFPEIEEAGARAFVLQQADIAAVIE